MELETEARVMFSPGARVVVGAPLALIVVAALVGFALGVIMEAVLSGRRWRRRRRAQTLADILRPPLRLPADNPDIETEL